MSRTGLFLGVLALLALAAPAPAGGLRGKITGGKAKKLVDQAKPLMKKGDTIVKQTLVLAETPEEQIDDELRKAEKFLSKACTLLDQALAIQNDPAVISLLRHAAGKLTKVQTQLFMRKQRRKHKEREERRAREEAERGEKQPEAAEEDEPPPEAAEEDEAPPEARDAAESGLQGLAGGRGSGGAMQETPQEVSFGEGQPPGVPLDVKLPRMPDWMHDADWEKQRKRAFKAIKSRLGDYFDARKKKNLVFTHRFCRGKGKTADGDECRECHGCGLEVNQFHFRRAFWNGYSPILRDTPGALDQLVAFYEIAKRDPAKMGPLIKTFKVAEIQYNGYWARAKVASNTTQGKQEEWLTLIQLGDLWYLYTPAADRELVPQMGG